jgi:hypothetical protein
MKKRFQTILLLAYMLAGCSDQGNQTNAKRMDDEKFREGSFGYDLNFLKQHDSVVVLKSDDELAQVIVSPKYQAKVFTSTATGSDGLSFGWVNYKAFTGTQDPHMNAYGGENRFWLGPEGGKFSLFFKPGMQMNFDNWKTPAPFDTERWEITEKTPASVSLRKEMTLTNYQGTEMWMSVDRKITILDRQQIHEKAGIEIDTTVNGVGYETVNVLTNKGTNEWTATSGMPCMWILDMFRPTPATVIIVPFKNAARLPFNRVATTNYFGEIPVDRLKHTDDLLYFKADGKSRGKLGVVPAQAKPVAGSYDASNKVLTIVKFDVEPTSRYLNQEWNTTKPPFSGDAVNAYNDGPLADGTQMGPFYEIESVSPAAFLKRGGTLAHTHSVYHFTGAAAGLDAIARKVFGVPLATIEKVF